MRPVVQALAKQYGQQVRFIEADVRTEKGITLGNEYQVMYIPAMFFLNKKGEMVDSLVGETTKDQLETRLKKIIQ